MEFNLKKNSAYIIAEIGNNHEGSFARAKKMISLASNTGVNAVKFQTFKTENFVFDNEKQKKLKKFELSYDEFEKLKNVAHKNNLNFISTPLDIESAKFLGKIADAIKISSGDNNFLELINVCLSFDKHIIISLGLLDHYETKKTINKLQNLFFKKKKIKNLSFLHCVTSYPVQYENANLQRIVNLKKSWPSLKFGYSDHTLGFAGCLAARVLGAEIIEKHFTLDKKFSKFRDHALSADEDEMKSIVLNIRKIEKMTKEYSKNLSKDENNNKKIVRRHPFSKRKISKGEKINHSNIKFLRPEKPMEPIILERIIGKKMKRNISAESIIKKRDLK